MASKDTTGSSSATATPSAPPFMDWGQGQTEAAASLQKAFLESCEQASRTWIDRMQSEVALWSDLANKLSTTRAMPEAMEAYAQCLSKRMQMAADDGRRLVDESQLIAQKITQSLGKGWLSGGT